MSKVEESASASEAENSKRKDSSVDPNQLPQLPSVPVPFVVVEKVPDQAQPDYGDVEPESLPVDEAKRAADAEPDVENVTEDKPVAIDQPKIPEIPLLVVEKTDDEPAYGEDFGEQATISQRVAHDLRAADASPDKLIISPESHSAPSKEEDAAPLLRHELSQTDDQPTVLVDADEESAHSSTDQTSSTEVIHTPSEHNDSPEDSDLNHELELKGTNENGAPLLPHESNLDDEDEVSTDDDDEFERAPLLPHESGFSGQNGRATMTNGDRDHGAGMEHQHHVHHDEHDDESDTDLNGDYDVSPLLPHERDTFVASNTGSEASADDSHRAVRGRSSFGHETNNARELFGGNRQPNFFRTRSNSSTLPHELPRSDAEDENLNDPLLERFPTSRDEILERVATIGLHLPEDQLDEDHLHSPQLSVKSQACSSVDLVQVKSYISLASVPEADDSDEDDQYDRDSLSSPMMIATKRSSSHNARDHHPPVVPEENEEFDLPEAKLQPPSAHSAESSEVDSVSNNDGSKDNSSTMGSVREAIASPANVVKSVTSDGIAMLKRDDAVGEAESQLRQRRSLKDESSDPTQESIALTSEDKAAQSASPVPPQPSGKQNENFLQSLIRMLFGSIGRFLAACIGDRKRAR